METDEQTQTKPKWSKKIIALIVFLLTILTMTIYVVSQSTVHAPAPETTTTTTTTKQVYKQTEEEKAFLKKKFEELANVNKEVIAYLYLPGTKLDEPVVQTSDNFTYLEKTFEGEQVPFLGAVFMDTNNQKDFSDRLTWLFAHARGSKVPDNRMFNDVNYYDKQEFFDAHPFVVVETPEKKLYYQAVAMVIVPETTAFYRTTFKDDDDFLTQLEQIKKDAQVKNESIQIKASDKYMVLSTCREEDDTLRANLYVRQIPEDELQDFLMKNKEKLKYVKTRE
ncbi:class B sortase [Granulicatella sp. zg-ZJ]|uniref:class B sortase, LPKTxAVK-specific n=2 Tax=unclassified Granulicatella TaxID=2630493 RepID=UPI0013C05A7E|nr:class B sortase [Carnobacteriaceae bacterium zg-ZUI78]NEW62345.1 class B sortase [Granulicatella sp. zg-ZJ]NEW65516.1 class B sortase [Granulicatella sp. zg-84]QMI86693.1 class B sortase [Carnobacteriaceae bacterium zg-84]